MSEKNEAAERAMKAAYVLRVILERDHLVLFEEAMRGERRATVERIREAVKDADGPVEYASAIWRGDVDRALDEEAAR